MLKLTDKEKEVARLTVKGLSNKEIAVNLGVKSETIAAHLLNIFKKLKIKNRTQLLLIIKATPCIIYNNQEHTKQKSKRQKIKRERVKKLKEQRLKAALMISSLSDYVAINFVKVELQKILTTLRP